jgi:predicted small secreted protein
MRKQFAPLVAFCLAAFGAAGCNTVQLANDATAASGAIGAAAAADPRVAKFAAKVNATIAGDSTKLASAYCPKAQEISNAAGIVSLFAGGTTASVISDARNFFATFCGAPPTSASEAIALGQQLLRDAVSIGLVTL